MRTAPITPAHGSHSEDSMKDFLGQNINVGDRIVYAVKRSTSCDLTVARVVRLDVRRPRYGGVIQDVLVVQPENRSREVTLERLDRIVRVL